MHEPDRPLWPNPALKQTRLRQATWSVRPLAPLRADSDIFIKGFVTILAVSALLMVIAIPLALAGFRAISYMALYANYHGQRRDLVRSQRLFWSCAAHFNLVRRFPGLRYLSRAAVPAAVFLPVSVLVLAAPTLVATVATMRRVRTLTTSID